VRVVQGAPCTVMEQGVCCAGKHRAQCSLVVYYCLEAPCVVQVRSACSSGKQCAKYINESVLPATT
jgi:hypothetical protein